MTNFGIGLITIALSIVTGAQIPAPVNASNSPQVQTLEIYGPSVFIKGVEYIDNSRLLKSCFDLVLLEQKCDKGVLPVQYGVRFNDDWDIFQIAGIKDSQTRMVDLGELKWTDKFVVPNIEPWPKLAPGESRVVKIDASGADGLNGSNGVNGRNGSNGDGTSKSARSRSSEDKVAPKKNIELKAPDQYSPICDVKLGHMYAIRVVVTGKDYYLLLRVDELVRGDKVTISWKKL